MAGGLSTKIAFILKNIPSLRSPRAQSAQAVPAPLRLLSQQIDRTASRRLPTESERHSLPIGDSIENLQALADRRACPPGGSPWRAGFAGLRESRTTAHFTTTALEIARANENVGPLGRDGVDPHRCSGATIRLVERRSSPYVICPLMLGARSSVPMDSISEWRAAPHPHDTNGPCGHDGATEK